MKTEDTFTTQGNMGGVLIFVGVLALVVSVVLTAMTYGIGFPAIIGSVFIVALGQVVRLLAEIERNTRAIASRIKKSEKESRWQHEIGATTVLSR